MPEHSFKPILQFQSPHSHPLHSSDSLFSNEAKSGWKIPNSGIKLQESRHQDQAQRNVPFLHPVKDPGNWEALGLELVTHRVGFHAQNPAESPRQSLLLHNKSEHH